MSKDLVEESPLYRQWVTEAATKGREESARDAVISVWRTRFGEPDAAVLANLAQRRDATELLLLAGTLSATPDLTAARQLLGLGPQTVPA